MLEKAQKASPGVVFLDATLSLTSDVVRLTDDQPSYNTKLISLHLLTLMMLWNLSIYPENSFKTSSLFSLPKSHKYYR